MYNTDPRTIQTIHHDRLRAAEHARLVATVTADSRNGRGLGLLARLVDRLGRGENSGFGRRRPGTGPLRPAHTAC